MKSILVLLIVAYSRSSNAGITASLPADLDINDIKTFKGFDDTCNINPFKDSNETMGQKFAAKWGRNYTAEEFQMRLNNIWSCIQSIISHIFKSHTVGTTFNVGLSTLCDRTDAEKAALLGTKPPPKIFINYNRRKRSGIYNTQCATPNATLPTSYNATAQGIVTSVKNQQQCGDCWAFASTGAFESRILKLGGASLDLAEQDLLNCAVSNGCNGASIDSAYNFVINNGQAREAACPYTATVGTCNHCPLVNGYKMTDYCGFGYTYTITYPNKTQVSTTEINSDAKIMQYIQQQGVVVGTLDASNLASANPPYTSGIYSYSNCSNTSTNHAIVIVGWGTQNGTNYWICKNSWGTSWGEYGYFRIKRGICGINLWVYFPIVSSTAAYNNNTCSSG